MNKVLRPWGVWTALASVVLTTACGGGEGPADVPGVPVNSAVMTADVTVLMMGNSHRSLASWGPNNWCRPPTRTRACRCFFAEWPRLGIAETDRIYELHVRIASAQPACVPPIGQAWDLAAQRHPGLRLHSSDGNHADTLDQVPARRHCPNDAPLAAQAQHPSVADFIDLKRMACATRALPGPD